MADADPDIGGGDVHIIRDESGAVAKTVDVQFVSEVSRPEVAEPPSRPGRLVGHGCGAKSAGVRLRQPARAPAKNSAIAAVNAWRLSSHA
jgi:hypothetical protein